MIDKNRPAPPGTAPTKEYVDQIATAVGVQQTNRETSNRTGKKSRRSGSVGLIGAVRGLPLSQLTMWECCEAEGSAPGRILPDCWRIAMKGLRSPFRCRTRSHPIRATLDHFILILKNSMFFKTEHGGGRRYSNLADSDLPLEWRQCLGL
jgi:hypothetical protein